MDIRKRYIFAIAASLLLLVLIFAEAVAQSKMSAAPAPKTAGETYKNIQVLKDAPAEQLIPAMQFISGSLGVGCDHCHVRGGFEKDDKQAKQTARKMMQMMFAINQTNFGGHQEVTCYSCHRGATDPVSIPIIAEETTPPLAVAQTNPADLPSADKLVEKYIQAIGGADALHKISSRSEKGKAILVPGREFPMELEYKSPDKSSSTIHLPDGLLATASGDHGGWQATPGHPIRDMSDAEIDAAKLDSNFYFPLHVQELFTELKIIGSEKVGGHPAYVVVGKRQDQSKVKLYFDQDSGLLIRLVRYEETPVGKIPVQNDYSDYRDASGIKVPFDRVTSRPSRRIELQISQVDQNAVIEDSSFDKPAPQTAGQPPMPPK
jgi:photosynthetic reaction center cytochrome c subunit